MPNFDFQNKKIPINYSPEETPIDIKFGDQKPSKREYENIDFLFPEMEDNLSVKINPKNKHGVIDTVNQAYETGRPDVDIMKGLVNESFDADEFEKIENLKEDSLKTFNQATIEFLNTNNINQRAKRREWYSSIQNDLELLFELLETSSSRQEIEYVINKIALLIEPAMQQFIQKQSNLDKYL